MATLSTIQDSFLIDDIPSPPIEYPERRAARRPADKMMAQ